MKNRKTEKQKERILTCRSRANYVSAGQKNSPPIKHISHFYEAPQNPPLSEPMGGQVPPAEICTGNPALPRVPGPNYRLI